MVLTTPEVRFKFTNKLYNFINNSLTKGNRSCDQNTGDRLNVMVLLGGQKDCKHPLNLTLQAQYNELVNSIFEHTHEKENQNRLHVLMVIFVYKNTVYICMTMKSTDGVNNL